MKDKGRYDRYIATSRKTGLFKISLFTDEERNEKLQTEKDLNVCINCLKALNYNGAEEMNHWQTRELRDSFDIGDFFEEYSTYFKEKPKDTCETIKINNYTDDWDVISKKKRVREDWGCENCGVNLQRFKSYLQTHHQNEKKYDNRLDNLEALCLICHAEKHPHMTIPNESKKLIIKERKRQGLA